jgi:hypothetical protein
MRLKLQNNGTVVDIEEDLKPYTHLLIPKHNYNAFEVTKQQHCR